jgi:hypothetical protein
MRRSGVRTLLPIHVLRRPRRVRRKLVKQSLSLIRLFPSTSAQARQWEIVRNVPELLDDQQAEANGFIQWVDYRSNQQLPLVANPIQFDHTPRTLGLAPGFSAQADEILLELGWDQARILEGKVAGIVV